MIPLFGHDVGGGGLDGGGGGGGVVGVVVAHGSPNRTSPGFFFYRTRV